MANVPCQTYCGDCHCVIPIGWPKVSNGDAWRCVTCEYDSSSAVAGHVDTSDDPEPDGRVQ